MQGVARADGTDEWQGQAYSKGYLIVAAQRARELLQRDTPVALLVDPENARQAMIRDLYTWRYAPPMLLALGAPARV